MFKVNNKNKIRTRNITQSILEGQFWFYKKSSKVICCVSITDLLKFDDLFIIGKKI